MSKRLHIRAVLLLITIGSWLQAQVTVQSVNPARGALTAPANSNITIAFGAPVNIATLTPNCIRVRGSISGEHVGSLTISDSSSMTFNPGSDFLAGERVYVDLSRKIKNSAGDSLSGGYQYDFMVATTKGEARFAPLFSASITGSSRKAAAADLDGDGDIDVVIAHYASTPLTIAKSDGAGGYTLSTISGSGFMQSVALADVDNDGDQDIIAAGYTMYVYLNNGSGSFTVSTSSVLGIVAYDIATGDFDGDGDIDIAATGSYSSTNQTNILLNNGTGVFVAAPVLALPSNTYPQGIKAMDKDSDGDIDLFVALSESNGIAFLTNDGSGGFTSTIQTVGGAGASRPRSIAYGDFDNDGDQDLAINYWSYSTNSLLKNSGSGTFTETQFPALGPYAYSLVEGDVDHDGDLDLVNGNYMTNALAIQKNNGAGGFNSIVSVPTGGQTVTIIPADIDGDGDLDLIAVNTGDNTFNVYENAGYSTSVSSMTTFASLPSTPSSIQSYTISASLLRNDLKIIPPLGFSVSLTGGVNFDPHDTLIVARAGDSVSTTTIFVRFTASAEQTVTDSIAHLSIGSVPSYLVVHGSGIASEPLSAASAIAVSSVAKTSFDLQWTNGDGQQRIVVISRIAPLAVLPQDGVSYTANSRFGMGAALSSDASVVYNGTGTSQSVTGLDPGATYYVSVFEYNGSAGSENYLTAGYPEAGQSTASYSVQESPGMGIKQSGFNQYLQIPASAAYSYNEGFTYEMWVLPTGTAYTRVFSSDDYFAGRTNSALFNNGLLQWTIGNGIGGVSRTFEVGAITTGVWHHLAFTFEQATGLAKIYVDGVAANDTTTAAPQAGGSVPIAFFGASGQYGSLSGRYDEIRIWNTVRSEQQIREHLHHALPAPQKGLAGYWQFNEGSGSTATDLINDNNATLGNFSFDQYSNWTSSNATFGGGSSASASGVTSSAAAIGSVTVIPVDPFDNPVDITVSEVHAVPTPFLPSSLSVVPGTYWILNAYGSPGTFSADLRFAVPSGYTVDGAGPASAFKLYRRSRMDTTAWVLVGDSASLVESGAVTFAGVTSFGQFLVATTTRLILSMTPNANSISVPADTSITFTANQPLNGATIDPSNIIIRGSVTGVHSGSVSQISPSSFTFDPDVNFAPGEVVTVMVKNPLTSTYGFALSSGYQESFRIKSAIASGEFLKRGTAVTTVSSPNRVIAADFNGDGASDLAVIGNSASVSTHLNTVGGAIGSQQDYVVTAIPTYVAAFDIDADGDQDIALAFGNSTISFLMNDGTGTFTTGATVASGNQTQAFDFGDMDGDGDIDIALANGTYSFNWIRNDGGSYTIVTGPYNGVFSFIRAFLSDVDNDGDLDYVGCAANQTIYVYSNDGRGVFTNSQTLGGVNTGYDATIGDIDGDGDADIVQSLYWNNAVAIVRNNGNGAFARDPLITFAYYPQQICLGDVDGDGDLDIMGPLSDPYKESFYLLTNDGTGSYSSTVRDLGQFSGSYDRAGTIVDLNGDGDLDYVHCPRTGGTIKTWMNVSKITIATALTDFGSMVRGRTSEQQQYKLHALGLSNSLVLHAPQGFHLSLQGGPNFAPVDSIELNPINRMIDSTTIYVRFDPIAAATYGASIVHTAAEADTQFVAVTGTGIAPVLSLSRTLVDMGTHRVNRTADDTVWVRNTGTSELTISGINATNGMYSGFVGSPVVPVGDSTFIRVHFQSGVPYPTTAYLLISNDADTQVDSLEVRGNGIAPQIYSDISGYTFGPTPLGRTDSISFHLHNTGSDTLFLLSLMIDNGEFSVWHQTDTVVVGDSIAVKVFYHPTAEVWVGSTLSYFDEFTIQGLSIYGTATNGVTVSDTSIAEGNTGSSSMRFAVRLTIPASQFITMNYQTVDQTALSTQDYSPTNGQLIFVPGMQVQYITVPVRGERYYESDETFRLVIDNTLNALPLDSSAVGTILNDDAPLSGAVSLQVNDIAADQGGRVRLRWNRAPFDTVDVDPQIVTYGVWRRIPNAVATSAAPRQGLLKSTFAASVQNDTLGTLYDFLGTVPAVQSPSYRFEATTLGDSSASDIPVTSYLVTAHTANPSLFAISSHVLGYSVDNIAPSAVAGASSEIFDLSHIVLKWNKNRFDNDMKQYAVYRSVNPGSSIVGQTPLAILRDTSFVDTTIALNSTYYYRIAGIDVHDNIGTPSIETSVAVPLAMTLSSFTAVVTNAGSLSIAWTTVSEEGTVGFEIERRKLSEEGTWKKVGFVKGSGNSNVPLNYSFIDRPREEGRYAYRLKEVEQSGKFTLSHAQEVDFAIPRQVMLAQNYPNPFNPSTTVDFTVADEGITTLRVYNMIGQEVATLFDGIAEPGRIYQTRFDGKTRSSGVYFTRLESGGKVVLKKMVLMK